MTHPRVVQTVWNGNRKHLAIKCNGLLGCLFLCSCLKKKIIHQLNSALSMSYTRHRYTFLFKAIHQPKILGYICDSVWHTANSRLSLSIFRFSNLWQGRFLSFLRHPIYFPRTQKKAIQKQNYSDVYFNHTFSAD